MSNAARCRVVHVVPDLVLGGASRGVLEIVKELNARGIFDAHLCVCGKPPVMGLQDDVGAKVRYLGYPVFERQSFLPRARALGSFIKEARPRLVHAHLWPAAAVTAWVTRGGRIPTLIHIRDTPPRLMQQDLRASVKRWVYQRLFAQRHISYIAVSQTAAEYTQRALKVPMDRIAVVLNGVDVTPFGRASELEREATGGAARRFVVGAAGRFVADKGHLFLLRAFASLVRQGYDMELRIVGEGGLRKQYEQFVCGEGLDGRVAVLEPTCDMMGFFRSLDVFVLPSLTSEGLPRVLLEAMACALPVISTDCAGAVEVIQDRRNGLLVRRGDAFAIESAITELFHQAGFRESLGGVARAHIFRFHTLDRVVDGISEIYSQRLAID